MIWQVPAMLFICCPLKASLLIIIILRDTVKHHTNQATFQVDLWVLGTMMFLVYIFSFVV